MNSSCANIRCGMMSSFLHLLLTYALKSLTSSGFAIRGSPQPQVYAVKAFLSRTSRTLWFPELWGVHSLRPRGARSPDGPSSATWWSHCLERSRPRPPPRVPYGGYTRAQPIVRLHQWRLLDGRLPISRSFKCCFHNRGGWHRCMSHCLSSICSSSLPWNASPQRSASRCTHHVKLLLVQLVSSRTREDMFDVLPSC